MAKTANDYLAARNVRVVSQVRASFALSGIELTDEDAERAGKIIAGVLTLDQAREEISARYRQVE